MIITVDGDRVDTAPEATDTLQALVDRVRLAHVQPNVVTNVALDGRELAGAALAARLQEPVGDIEQVDLDTAQPTLLGAEVLREVAGALQRTAEQQPVIADQITASADREAIGRVAEVIEAWHHVHQALGQVSELLGRDLTAEVVGASSVIDQLGTSITPLRQLRDALRDEDYVLVADHLRYEMPDLCNDWSILLDGLACKLDPLKS